MYGEGSPPENPPWAGAPALLGGGGAFFPFIMFMKYHMTPIRTIMPRMEPKPPCCCRCCCCPWPPAAPPAAAAAPAAPAAATAVAAAFCDMVGLEAVLWGEHGG